MTAPPPLYPSPRYGPPPGGQTEWLTAADGKRLRIALFAKASARGSVVLNNGRTEFIEKYYEVIGELLGRGYSVLAHDWRGQGLSDRLLPDPLKGHADGAAPFLSDFKSILTHYGPRLPRPWILMGHSMGGALSLLHLLQGGDEFQACVLSSPMTGVNLHGNAPWLVKLGIIGRRLIGRLGDYVEPPGAPPWDDVFEGNSVTHDPVRFGRTVGLLRDHHDLALGGATWGWLDFALRASDMIQGSPAARGLKLPMRVVAAGDETLADTLATQAFCQQVPNALCTVAPGARHEILMETDETRRLFWSAFDGIGL